MSYFDTEKAIIELDYNLKKESIDNELSDNLQELVSVHEDGFWFNELKIDDVEIDKIFINNNGITLFCKFEKEFTDTLLWEEAKNIYDTASTYFENIKPKHIVLYLLLNTPIIQLASYALYQPGSEFIIPIKGLKTTFEADLLQREIIWSEEELLTFISEFTSQMEEYISEDDEVFEDYIRIRGKLKIRSEVDPVRYFNLTLWGGIIGLHKLYIKSYLSFICYLFTLGFCGIGWAFDLIEIYLGISKDKRRAYIGPYGNKKNFVFIPIFIYLSLFVLLLFIL